MLAEKLETVIARSTLNTWMCDFYDIHILWSEKADIINIDTIRRAIINVARKRGTIELFDNTDENLRDIVESDYLRDRNKRRLEAVRHSRVQRLCGNARRVQKKRRGNDFKG